MPSPHQVLLERCDRPVRLDPPLPVSVVPMEVVLRREKVPGGADCRSGAPPPGRLARCAFRLRASSLARDSGRCDSGRILLTGRAVAARRTPSTVPNPARLPTRRLPAPHRRVPAGSATRGPPSVAPAPTDAEFGEEPAEEGGHQPQAEWPPAQATRRRRDPARR